MTSLFYGVNWCQFFPFLSIGNIEKANPTFGIVAIKGYKRIEYSSIFFWEFSKH